MTAAVDDLACPWMVPSSLPTPTEQHVATTLHLCEMERGASFHCSVQLGKDPHSDKTFTPSFKCVVLYHFQVLNAMLYFLTITISGLSAILQGCDVLQSLEAVVKENVTPEFHYFCI